MCWIVCRYPPGNTAQQSSTQQNSNFPPSTPSSSSLNQNDQLYTCGDSQTSQNYSSQSNPLPGTNSSYSANQPQSRNSSIANYPAENNPGQERPFKGSEDQYWQQNYQQPFRQGQNSGDTFYRGDANDSRFQGNYFPVQNYQNQSQFDFAGNPERKMSDDGKTAQAESTGTTRTQSNEDTGMPNQHVLQNNLPINIIPGMKNVAKNFAEKEDEKEKDEKSDEDIIPKEEEKDAKFFASLKEEPGIPYDWVRTNAQIVGKYLMRQKLEKIITEEVIA